MSARVGRDIGGTFPDIVLRLPEPFDRSAPLRARASSARSGFWGKVRKGAQPPSEINPGPGARRDRAD